jgi:hypothetical protein
MFGLPTADCSSMPVGSGTLAVGVFEAKEPMANQWIVLIPLEAVKKSDPTTEIFIEAGNVLDGIQVPETELTSNDPPIEFTCNGEPYNCERLDLETCARPRS